MTDAQAMLIAAILTVIPTAAVGVLNWVQSRRQHRIAAYERRLAVYRAVQGALSDITRDGTAYASAIDAIKLAWQDSRFLFPKKGDGCTLSHFG
jgi:hypothetical protein